MTTPETKPDCFGSPAACSACLACGVWVECVQTQGKDAVCLLPAPRAADRLDPRRGSVAPPDGSFARPTDAQARMLVQLESGTNVQPVGRDKLVMQALVARGWVEVADGVVRVTAAGYAAPRLAEV